MSNFNDAVAVVTGGGRGIGRAIALSLAQAGAAVMVSARSANEIEETAALIRQAGGRATACPADVSDLAAVREMFARTEAELGAPTILVNNAGGGVPNSSGPFEKIAPGRQFSEVAKRPDTWKAVKAASFSEPSEDIPEISEE